MNLLNLLFSSSTSQAGKLNIQDILKGLFIAVFVPVITQLFEIVSAWANSSNAQLVIDWKSLFKIAVASFIAYLSKNLFTSNQPLK